MTLSFTRDTVGTLACSVRDAILLDQLVTAEPTGAHRSGMSSGTALAADS